MIILIALIVAIFLFGFKRGVFYVLGALLMFFCIMGLAAGLLWAMFSL